MKRPCRRCYGLAHRVEGKACGLCGLGSSTKPRFVVLASHVEAALARAFDAEDEASRCSERCVRYRQLIAGIKAQRTLGGRRTAKRQLVQHVLTHQPSMELVEP